MLDPIGVIFQLKDQASRNIGNLQNKFQELHGTSDRVTKAFNANGKQLMKGMSLMVGGAIGGSVLRGFADDATTFQASLTKMASAARASKDDVKSLSDKALELGVKFEFSPEETILGMKSLASAGLNVNQILTSIPSAMQLAGAAAGEITIPQAAETLTAAMKGYGMAAKDSGNIIDTLSKATQISNLRFGEFQEALGSAAGKAMVVNQSFQTTLATLGLLRNTGLRALTAAEKFKMTLQTLIQPQAARRAKELGVSLREPSGKLKQLDAIVGELAPKLNKLSQQQRETAIGDLFGFRSMEVYQAIVGGQYENQVGKIFRGADALKAMREELIYSKHTAQNFQKAFLKTTEGSRKLLEGAWQTLRIHLGRPLLDPIRRLNKWLLRCLEKILDLCNQSPRFSKLVTGTAAVASGLAVIIGSAIAAKAAISMLSMAIGPVGLFFRGTSMLMLKGLLIVGALILAFIALKYAYDHNLGGIADVIDKMTTALSLFARTAWGCFSKGYIGDDLKKELEAAGLMETVNQILRLFEKISITWQGFKTGFIQGWEQMEPIMSQAMAFLAKAWDNLHGILGNFIDDLDKADGGLVAHVDTLERMLNVGQSIGLIVGYLCGYVVTQVTRVFGAMLFLIDWVIKACTTLYLGLQKIINLWSVFRDSSLGIMLFGKRLQVQRQYMLINGIHDFHAAFPQQRAIAAQQQSLRPVSDDPIFTQLGKYNSATLNKMYKEHEALPQILLRSFRGAKQHDLQLSNSFLGGLNASNTDDQQEAHLIPNASLGAFHNFGQAEPQAAKPVPQSFANTFHGMGVDPFETFKKHMATYGQRAEKPPVPTTQPTHVPREPPVHQQPVQLTTQIVIDGKKMAEVVNTHNLRAAKHQGQQW